MASVFEFCHNRSKKKERPSTTSFETSFDQFVEQVVVKHDSLTGAHSLHVKDQVGHTVVRQTHVILPNSTNDSSQTLSHFTQGPLIVDH